MERLIKLFEKNKIISMDELKSTLLVDSSKDFVKLIKNVEKLIKNEELVQLKNEKFLYVEKEMEFEGIIKINSSGFAFVYCQDIESEIYIPRGYTRSAMTGDKVRVRLDDFYSEEKNLEGIVIAVVERNKKHTVGTLIRAKRFSYVKSDDKNIDRYIRIEKETLINLVDGQKVIVEITEYAKTRFDDHRGIIIKSIGHKDDPGIDIVSTIYKHNIPTEFSKEVEIELDRISEEVTMKNPYRDCRDELVVTIDGDDSKDLDDAISVIKLKSGYRLKVFIADVSSYVTENSELDKEAQNRGCSVYLIDRVVPMLPRKLSNNVCSLNPNVDRYTICCEMEFNADGAINSYDIYPAVINSKGRLTYGKVNAVFENDKEVQEEYKEYLKMLNKALELTLKIRKNREQRGAINFNKSEAKIILNENSTVKDIILRENSKAERLIEDCMISANEVVAEHFYWLETPFIYRVHEQPRIEKLRQFFELSASLGYRVQANLENIEAYTLANMLKKFKKSPVENMLSTVLLRTMNQAKYSIMSLGHFALASKYYTHFTSPIRRYPDLLVHRMIRSYIFNGDISQANKEHFYEILPNLAEKSSVYEKRAVDCEREVEQIKKCEYMLERENQEFDGIVSSVTRFGVFISLSNTIEGLSHIKNMLDDYYEFDERNLILVGKRKKKIYRIGDKVKVKVDNVNLENQTIDFKIIYHKETVRREDNKFILNNKKVRDKILKRRRR
ncbi:MULTISPECIES: ribonuclease R [unclassified Gemella]|uniref:ribonuclease R n=1 Tax=unclassified Gemella TaxID=2624949 RepID=UPI001073E996|nr:MULTISPECIES: ribonuclease R [unclassified Gemella]MBF0710114.1 ribonuclease R [Gemella sp. GL1.1]MBF0746193.1 ribonuclease R [Gemella sp. 19428wG2_WT2a]NYS27458.1 ribonuclease R [Gemella sp. GL1]TFU60478.1 ribonuclease R [Gemella sp. WT2a]